MAKAAAHVEEPSAFVRIAGPVPNRGCELPDLPFHLSGCFNPFLTPMFLHELLNLRVGIAFDLLQRVLRHCAFADPVFVHRFQQLLRPNRSASQQCQRGCLDLGSEIRKVT